MKKTSQQPLTEAKINLLKKEHGTVFQITVAPEAQEAQNGQEATDQGEPLVYVFKVPDRRILNAVGKTAQNNPFDASEVMLKSCLVHGDEKALDDIRVFTSVSAHFETIMEPRQSSLKKL